MEVFGRIPRLELVVDYQPQFGELGRSTPEFIVSRLVANADDRVTARSHTFFGAAAERRPRPANAFANRALQRIYSSSD